MEPATRQLIYVSRDPSAELNTRFHQRGWHVDYQAYGDDNRPSLMRLTYEGIELRLAISQWK